MAYWPLRASGRSTQGKQDVGPSPDACSRAGDAGGERKEILGATVARLTFWRIDPVWDLPDGSRQLAGYGGGNAAVVAENISNLGAEQFISVPELVLAGASDKEREALVPDLVISFRQQVVSKRLKLFLQSQEKLQIREFQDHPGRMGIHSLPPEMALLLSWV